MPAQKSATVKSRIAFLENGPTTYKLIMHLFPLQTKQGTAFCWIVGRDLSNGRVDVVFDDTHVGGVRAGAHLDSGVVLVPHPHPLTQCILSGLDHVQTLCFVNCLVEFLHYFRLGPAQDVPVDGFTFWGVACRVAALPPAILPFSNVPFAVGSSFRPVDRLLSQLPTLPDMCYLCPAVCFESDREKLPRLLVDLHHPWTGSFSLAFSLFSGSDFALRFALWQKRN